MPLRVEQNLEILGAKTPEYLKRSRAARAMTTNMTTEYQESALDYEKNEDPAKMKHSVPDFLTEPHRAKNQEFFQVLEGGSPRNKIKY